MLELYVIRHGFAGSPIEDKKLDDARPLKKKGREKIKDIAKSLKKQNICFDLVLTSPLLRAKETAEIFQDHCGITKKMQVIDLLKPGTSYPKLIKFLNEHKESKVAIVGHEPFLSGFASYCVSGSKSSFIDLKKGGIIKLEVDEVIKPGKCILSLLMDPKHII